MNRLNSSGAFFCTGLFYSAKFRSRRPLFQTKSVPKGRLCSPRKISRFSASCWISLQKKKQVQIKKKWFGQTDFGSVNHDREACSLRRSDCLRYALLSKYFFRFPNRSEIPVETRTRGNTSLNINYNHRLTNTNTARSKGLGTPQKNSGTNLKNINLDF